MTFGYNPNINNRTRYSVLTSLPTLGRLLLIFGPAGDRRLSWPEYRVGLQLS